MRYASNAWAKKMPVLRSTHKPARTSVIALPSACHAREAGNQELNRVEDEGEHDPTPLLV
jgi:hypothetical protein